MSLMTLPVELRQQIYLACLEADVDVTIPTRTFPRSRDGRLARKMAMTPQGLQYAARPASEKEPSPPMVLPLVTLSLTCKAIAEELRSIRTNTWECTLNIALNGPRSLTWNRITCRPAELEILIVNYNQFESGSVFGGDGGPRETTNAVFDIFKYFIHNGPTLSLRPLVTPIHLKRMTFELHDDDIWSKMHARYFAAHMLSSVFGDVVDEVRVRQQGTMIFSRPTRKGVFDEHTREVWAQYGFIWRRPD